MICGLKPFSTTGIPACARLSPRPSPQPPATIAPIHSDFCTDVCTPQDVKRLFALWVAAFSRDITCLPINGLQPLKNSSTPFSNRNATRKIATTPSRFVTAISPSPNKINLFHKNPNNSQQNLSLNQNTPGGWPYQPCHHQSIHTTHNSHKKDNLCQITN
jgi:hypothetical protein